jgi:hypothetical protein
MGKRLTGLLLGSALFLGCGRSGHHHHDPAPGPDISVSHYTPAAEASPSKHRAARPQPPSADGEAAAPGMQPDLLPESLQSAPSLGIAGRPGDSVRVRVVDSYHLVLTGGVQEEGSMLPSCYGHAADYSWLSGELRFVAARGVWRLHYAASGEEDPHGGTVTLAWDGPTRGWHSGQRVRVEGGLVDPTTQEPSPGYRVRAIHLLPGPVE